MYQQRDGGNRGGRGRFERRDNRPVDRTNARVCHIYDHSAKGTLVRNNDDETLVGVAWDARPNVVHPCIRQEILFLLDLERAKEKKLYDRMRDRETNMRSRDQDVDSFVMGA